ncbi:MAG TPA: MFS transporter [Pseudomonadales bacterium]|nr:MFS transporter [Pseudomonadales bacterium]
MPLTKLKSTLIPPGALTKDPETDRSLKHSLKDGAWFSAMIGSAESYFSAFAILLRANAAQIGILAAVPPLLASFTQLLSAWLGRRLDKRREIIVFGAVVQAGVIIPLALLPLMLPDIAMPVLITCAVIYFVGPNLGSPHWGSLMGDLVPDARRGRFFALRTRLSSLANFTALIAAGFILEAFDWLGATYWGFVVIFLFAAAARARSAWHLLQMQDPPRHVDPQQTPWLEDLRAGLRESSLMRFSVFYACMQAAVALASPFFALYMLRDLQFSYVAFMFNTTASVAVQFLTLSRWGRLSDLFGNRLIMVTTGVMIPFLPSLWLLSTNYFWLLAVQMLSGLCWAGFTLSTTNSVYDLTPRARRTTLMAVHNVLGATGVFVGASIGGWLGTHLPNSATLFGETFAWLTPLYGVFVASTLARLAVTAWFLPRLKELRRVRPMTRRGLIFRVTRMSPVSAAVFEVVGRTRRANGGPGTGPDGERRRADRRRADREGTAEETTLIRPDRRREERRVADDDEAPPGT